MATPPPAPSAATVQKGFSALSLDTPIPAAPEVAALPIEEKLAKLAAITGAPLSQEDESQLRALFAEKPHPIAYDGFEPSGRVTLASGLLRALNAQRLLAAGCHVRLLVADTHALLNNKFGGDLKKLQSISTYMVEVWKALGLDAEKVPNLEIMLASTETARHAGAYWSQVLDAAGRFTVERVQQCAPIMGRSTEDSTHNTNRILYPLMQCADGFLLQADIYQMGADQEAGNELVRDYIAQKELPKKPVFLTHPLLLGLKQEQFKMSTTDAESAIYMDDTAAEVKTKIKKAYCVPGEVNGNPILNYMKYLVFPSHIEGVTLERSEKNGGNLIFATYEELETAFAGEKVHPADLKPCLTKYINALLEPVRQHFAGGPLKTMFSSVKKLKVSPTPDSDKLANLTLPGFPESVKEWKASELSLDERYAVARSVGEECIQENELCALVEKKDHPVCYDGFEPSGRMHIAQGVLRTVNVNKLTSAGSVFRFWVADWFAILNNKMGGDLDKIRLVGQYMVEIWKSVGMDMTNVEFLWASKEIIAHSASYWLRVMDIARRTTIARTLKCCTIMGRKEKEGMQAAQILYPLMQCADIFNLKADICQLGIDQRKINMLARDYCDQAKIRFKPVILSHHMLMGLKEGQEKMSKSDPESAIFMEDAAEDVSRKIEKAFCPEGVVEANPILDYLKHIICPRFAEQGVTVKLTDGQSKTFAAYQELEDAFVVGQVNCTDLKVALTNYLNEILEPVREHFSKGDAKELLAKQSPNGISGIETSPAVDETKQEETVDNVICSSDDEVDEGDNDIENQDEQDEKVAAKCVANGEATGKKNGLRLLDVASVSVEGSQGHANEDRLLVTSNEHFHLFAVMDGHGGSWAGDFLVDKLFGALDAVYEDGFDHTKLTNAMEELDRSFCAQAMRKTDFSGACLLAVILYVDPTTDTPQKLVLNIGDCRAIIREAPEPAQGDKKTADKTPSSTANKHTAGGVTFALSEDHCAANCKERMRALRSGAYIHNNRIAGVLEPFRTIGDIDVKGPDMKNWVIATPEIHQSELLVSRSMLVIATDGVWSVLNNNRTMALVVKELGTDGRRPSAESAAHVIITEARELGSCDDISVIVVSV
ncbi:hypothetical protein BBJ29_004470 [Phytophthora kernoviae]|uniref:tyrosine--tRNA ligase n=1 Tax=Phytophthora kernoviae TaxID=325452 RepID=A0A3F2RI47_9STRA|nr:hypothetical protein BBJ29_004470 [Phytophthora kernoviae]RLN57094.1 hypothetical protein BBP00_00007678 [Phytophthora kernoviae]